ncbi:MAG: thiamine-phosphate kinase [Planctomycetaceae bacterium]|jgi:thiamine-monophosphate kinase|nr:thiamine-phosphate kinase [Planctomycetaceae bacterium]
MELQLIEQLRQKAPINDSRVLLGIGDDAAILSAQAQDVVLTVDLLTEGVDFLLDSTDPQWIGRKALAVNLSDIAAMGASPTAVLVAVALPKKNAAELARRIYEGMQPLLEKYRVALIGGDTNTWNGGLVISITAIGHVTKHGALKRSGAKSGDRVLATGKFGGSILKRQFQFEPRIEEALYLNKHFKIHAAMDVSDGLSLDLSRMATESGVGVVIDADKIPISQDAIQLAKENPQPSPLERALFDGEDFELILATSPEEAEKLTTTQPLKELESHVLLTDIGEFVSESGQWLRYAESGSLQKISPRGFIHES